MLSINAARSISDCFAFGETRRKEAAGVSAILSNTAANSAYGFVNGSGGGGSASGGGSLGVARRDVDLDARIALGCDTRLIDVASADGDERGCAYARGGGVGVDARKRNG